ncbi:MarR family transcriptional regulator [Clostridium gasigenes]|uniref:MarR family winged helix-turn-helix transcriptional regulator n=1 Tax=Clostridium gasigenes TaxID=94869 RepID=UPI001C0B033E|nr:MarR family transcriptional regulator [Clostridium gasigenes]MBU3133975.1 MarR family transcriptional regulator [Clostridium gasigenes]
MNDYLKLENQLCFKVYSISKSIVRIYGPLLKDIKLTYPQYLTMMVLWENKKISFKDLSYKLKMKTGTLTPIVTKLESYGYIDKIKDEKDDRKIYIVITKNGIELEEKAKDIPRRLACSLGLEGDEYSKYMKDFEDLLKTLDNIEKYVE